MRLPPPTTPARFNERYAYTKKKADSSNGVPSICSNSRSGEVARKQQQQQPPPPPLKQQQRCSVESYGKVNRTIESVDTDTEKVQSNDDSVLRGAVEVQAPPLEESPLAAILMDNESQSQKETNSENDDKTFVGSWSPVHW
jgi:hypothetical protein